MKTNVSSLLRGKLLGSLLVLCAVSFSNVNAQGIPFPSESDALGKLKSSKSLANSLNKEYGINAISELSIVSDGTGFIAYYSREGMAYSNRIPKDGCTVVFIATSKKNSEGVSYKIPININYSRLVRENDYIGVKNSWEYYNYEVGSPIILGAKEISPALKTSLAYEALAKAAESNFKNADAGMDLYLYKLENCIKIDKIYQTEENLAGDNVMGPTEQIWTFTLIGDFAGFEGRGTKMTSLAENLEYKLELKVKKEAGQWVPKMIKAANITYGGIPEYEGDELYYTYKEVGLKGVYKKRSPKAIPRNSEAYLEFYSKKFETAVTSFTDNEEADLENLAFFMEDGNKAIAKSIRDFYIEMDKKQITRKGEKYSVSVSWEGKDKIRSATFRIYFTLNRVNGVTDKTAGKQFTVAGMSKKALKTGKFYERYEQRWDLLFKDDRWYITEKMAKDFEIPF